MGNGVPSVDIGGYQSIVSVVHHALIARFYVVTDMTLYFVLSFCLFGINFLTKVEIW